MEIITYERKSTEPVNCADLNQDLMDGGFSATTGQIVLWDTIPGTKNVAGNKRYMMPS